MQSRIRALGHGVHPILIVFPLGLLATSVAFDVVLIATGDATFALVSYWLIAAGIIGGLVAAVPGFVDWLGIPAGTRAKRIGLTHAIVNVCALALFFLSWQSRGGVPGYLPSGMAFGLSIAGAVLASAGGWFGGELVERLGVSVHDGAHLNAPSSLSGRRPSE